MTTFPFGAFWVLIGFRAITFPNSILKLEILGSPALGLGDLLVKIEWMVRGLAQGLEFPSKISTIMELVIESYRLITNFSTIPITFYWFPGLLHRLIEFKNYSKFNFIFRSGFNRLLNFWWKLLFVAFGLLFIYLHFIFLWLPRPLAVRLFV